jgi:hypothetical protein
MPRTATSASSPANGKLAHMTNVSMNAGDQKRVRDLMQSSVLKAWAKRADPEATAEWDATVGKVFGMKAGG